MSNKNNKIEVGCIAAVKVGRHEIPASILEIFEDGFKVQSTATNKTFKVKSVGRVITPRIGCLSYMTQVQAEAELAKAVKPEKKMSLLDAAVEVLKTTAKPMNTREMVKAAIEANLWTPTACKTPEQTLYGSIFREMSVKEAPRVRKSEQKGKFEFNEKGLQGMSNEV